MGKGTKPSGSRRGALRIEAARMNVDIAHELGRTPDARIVKIALQSLGDKDSYSVIASKG